MWMDQIGARQCQIGIDAFLAGLVVSVDQLSFITVGGACRPTIVLSVKGVDLRLAFPARFRITAANLYLRADPARLTADPYGAGWLFEGEPEEAGQLDRSLFRCPAAESWMKEETGRLEAWLRARDLTRDACLPFRSPDAGSFSCLEQLSKDDLLSLFDQFFYTDEKYRR